MTGPDILALPRLQDCRFEGLGTRAFGRAAIARLIADHPLPVAPVTAHAAGHACAFGESDGAPFALFADLSDGHIARLWRLGTASASARAPALLLVDVPHDPDRSQHAPGVGFRAADHPALAAAHQDAVAALADRIADTRALVLRAFSDGDRAAALLAVTQHAPGAAPRGVMRAVLLTFAGGVVVAHHVVDDGAGRAASDARPWLPRV